MAKKKDNSVSVGLTHISAEILSTLLARAEGSGGKFSVLEAKLVARDNDYDVRLSVGTTTIGREETTIEGRQIDFAAIALITNVICGDSGG